jgi:hypothetical protein
VTGNTQVPTNWASFLRVAENKTELHSFLTTQVVEFLDSEGKQVYCTDGESVVSSLFGMMTLSLVHGLKKKLTAV